MISSLTIRTSRPDEARWTLGFLTLAVILFALRLVLLVVSPLNLSGDEAYYWDWGRNLSWGYYSKPPFIGWWMGFAGWLGGDTEFGLRVWALVFGTVGLLALFFFGRRLFGARAAFWGMAALALSPANAALNQFLTIDAPLVCAWALSLMAAWQLFESDHWSWRRAIPLVLAMGWGVLTKQMMLIFPVLATLYLALDPERRRWLRHPGWWLTAASVLVFLLPPLYWNSQHDWITFRHTGTNLSSSSVSAVRQLGRFFEFIGSQVLLIGPVVYVLLLYVLTVVGRRWSRLTRAERFLFIFSAPGLAVFFVIALRQRALPNWPAVYYPAAFLLLGAWIARCLSFQGPATGRSRLVGWGIGLGASLMVAVYLLAFLSPLLSLKKDPFVRVRGWDAYGASIAAVEERHFEGGSPALLVVGHRYYASQLAFYHPARPRVFVWRDQDRVDSQYALWPGPETAPQREFLVIFPQEDPEVPRSLQEFFKVFTPLESMEVAVTATTFRRITLFRGERKSEPF